MIGLAFLLFTSTTFNFPTLAPLDSENMNYTITAIGIVNLISIVTWLTTGKNSFTGPQIGRAIPVLESWAVDVHDNGGDKSHL